MSDSDHDLVGRGGPMENRPPRPVNKQTGATPTGTAPTEPPKFQLTESIKKSLSLINPQSIGVRSKNLAETLFKPSTYQYIKSLLHNWTYFDEIEALKNSEKAKYEEHLRNNFFADKLAEGFSIEDKHLPRVEFDEPEIDDDGDVISASKRNPTMLLDEAAASRMVRPLRSQFHYGQLKLHLSEVILFNEILKNIPDPMSRKFVVVYAGFAPGNHIAILMDMYDKLDITWILIDPRAEKLIFPYLIDPTFRPERHKVEVVTGFLEPEDCLVYHDRFAGAEWESIFITDIRQLEKSKEVTKQERAKYDFTKMTAHEIAVTNTTISRLAWDSVVEEDNGLQKSFVDNLRFDHNLIKFRFPYNLKEPVEWYDGKIFYQLYGPETTTETRLYITKKKSQADFKRKMYDTNKYDEHLGYFNRFIRKQYYPHNYTDKLEGICHCYDCSRYIEVIEDYYNIMTKNNILPDKMNLKGKTVSERVQIIITWMSTTLVKYSKHKAEDRVVKSFTGQIPKLFDLYRKRYMYGLVDKRGRTLYNLEPSMAKQEIMYNLRRFFRNFKRSEIYEIFPRVSNVDSDTTWMQNNRSGFNEWIHDRFQIHRHDRSTIDSRSKPPMAQQLFVKQFIESATPYRGVLLYHNMGAGKTLAAVISAEALMDTRKVFILNKKSLMQTFLDEVKQAGHRLYRSTQNERWRWVAKSNIPKTILKSFLPESEIREGMWLPATIKSKSGSTVDGKVVVDEGRTMDELSANEIKSLKRQINTMVDHRYTCLVYNGNATQFDLLKKKSGNKNPFDNSVVIIDEVHNFTLKIPKDNATPTAKMVYDWIRTANNIKVICLSATPIVNDPFELAFLMNMLKGVGKRYTIKFEPYTKSITEYDIKLALTTYGNVDTFTINMKDGEIKLTLTPTGFHRVDKSHLALSTRTWPTETILFGLTQHLKKEGLPIIENVDIAVEEFDCLPTDASDFNQLFIADSLESDEFDKGQIIKNQELFQRRIYGAVSFYDAMIENAHRYAVRYDTEVVEVPMSPFQIEQYAIYRAVEKARETLSARSNNPNAVSSYRTDSILASTFALPANVKKPNKNKIKNQLINTGHDVSGASKILSKEQKRVFDYIKLHAEEILSDEGLSKHSTKFLKTMQMIRAEPDQNTLVYSAYNTMEGLAVFAMTLEHAGYIKFDVTVHSGKVTINCPTDVAPIDPATGKRRKHYIHLEGDNKKMLGDIYSGLWNSSSLLDHDIRDVVAKYFDIDSKDLSETSNLYGELISVVLISPSSAEGISLSNIRQVIIMNAFWNQGRIDQIVGRAHRLDVHRFMKPEERFVKSYLLLSTITDEDRPKAPKPANTEIYTSDQVVHRITARKLILSNKFQELLKATAIDCRTFQQRQNNDLMCYSNKNIRPDSIITYVDIRDDLDRINSFEERNYIQRTNGKWLGRSVPITIKGHEYDWAPDTGVFYENDVAIGKLTMVLNSVNQPVGSVYVELFDLPEGFDIGDDPNEVAEVDNNTNISEEVDPFVVDEKMTPSVEAEQAKLALLEAEMAEEEDDDTEDEDEDEEAEEEDPYSDDNMDSDEDDKGSVLRRLEGSQGDGGSGGGSSDSDDGSDSDSVSIVAPPSEFDRDLYVNEMTGELDKKTPDAVIPKPIPVHGGDVSDDISDYDEGDY